MNGNNFQSSKVTGIPVLCPCNTYRLYLVKDEISTNLCTVQLNK